MAFDEPKRRAGGRRVAGWARKGSQEMGIGSVRRNRKYALKLKDTFWFHGTCVPIAPTIRPDHAPGSLLLL